MKKRCIAISITLASIVLFVIFTYAEYIEGDCESGFGISQLTNGDKYEGNFNNGRLSGEGVVT